MIQLDLFAPPAEQQPALTVAELDQWIAELQPGRPDWTSAHCVLSDDARARLGALLGEYLPPRVWRARELLDAFRRARKASVEADQCRRCIPDQPTA